MKGQFIYKITNLVNDKFYVGSTNDTRERFRHKTPETVRNGALLLDRPNHKRPLGRLG